MSHITYSHGEKLIFRNHYQRQAMKLFKGQWYRCGLISLELGKNSSIQNISLYLHNIYHHVEFRFRNPTPESSYLPKWEKAETFPVSYFRIGNFHFEGKPTFGMDSGWIFDRIKFWREIDPHLPTNHLRKDEL